MPEQPIHLSTRQVQQLRQHGQCCWQRECAPMAPLPFARGQVLFVRESVAKPRAGETAYRYLADGQEAGRFYHKSYHMPAEAVRLRVRVAGTWYEFGQNGQWTYCFTLKLVPDAVPA